MTIAKFDNIEESDGVVFKAKPAGQYPCRITLVEDKETREVKADGSPAKFPKHPYWNFHCVVQEGAEGAGSKFFFTVLLPTDTMKEIDSESWQRSIDTMKRVLTACGQDAPKDGELDSQEFIGAELMLVVAVKNDRNQVTDFLPMEG